MRSFGNVDGGPHAPCRSASQLRVGASPSTYVIPALARRRRARSTAGIQPSVRTAQVLRPRARAASDARRKTITGQWIEIETRSQIKHPLSRFLSLMLVVGPGLRWLRHRRSRDAGMTLVVRVAPLFQCRHSRACAQEARKKYGGNPRKRPHFTGDRGPTLALHLMREEKRSLDSA